MAFYLVNDHHKSRDIFNYSISSSNCNHIVVLYLQKKKKKSEFETRAKLKNYSFDSIISKCNFFKQKLESLGSSEDGWKVQSLKNKDRKRQIFLDIFGKKGFTEKEVERHLDGLRDIEEKDLKLYLYHNREYYNK